MITPDLLKSFSPCAEGYRRFLELFPQGTDLATAIDGLVADGHDDWAYWLFVACKDRRLFDDVTAFGYWNSGNRNSGNWNSGDGNSGYRNSGNRNSGNRNSGDWNSGNRNSGYFNTTAPSTVRVFGKEIPVARWDAYQRPAFLTFPLCVWVEVSDMTDKEKITHPTYTTTEGFLREMTYKQAFRASWDSADQIDRMRITECPGFDADMFYEISGIDLRGKDNK